MEELLNKLIEKGWKPFDMEATRIEYRGGPEFHLRYYGKNKNGEGWNVRNLVSKESGLWQFVCENKLYKDYVEDRGTYWDSMTKCCNYRDYEYRLIESALCDEDKLEEFLLENIKVE